MVCVSSGVNNQQSTPDRGCPQRNVPHPATRGYITVMAAGTCPAKYRCAQCEMPEAQCECDKYCCLCQTVLEVRICQDGLMYCEPCRNACDYISSDYGTTCFLFNTTS